MRSCEQTMNVFVNSKTVNVYVKVNVKKKNIEKSTSINEFENLRNILSR